MAETYSIAGKVFILGEYAVLAGLPAVVAGVGPRFSLSIQNPPDLFHPHSPISRLKNWAQKMGLPELSFSFRDPLQGAGGFGASTAQFAMAYLAYSKTYSLIQCKWTDVWKLYRELMGDESIIPSGADLVAQWQGGVVFFDSTDSHCMDLWPIFDWSNLLVFSATDKPGRKVPTHEHLVDLSKRGLLKKDQGLTSELEKVLIQGISAIRENDTRGLGHAMNEYARVLSHYHLEIPATCEDRLVLGSLPGVLGIKGAGALQSDAVLILLEPGSPNRAHIIEMAQSRGLRLIQDGLACQMGVTCQS